jgi:Undecaprenyl-phosphate galactose phosphotransferase WbaP
VVADVAALAVAFTIILVVRKWLFGPLPPLHWGMWSSLVAWFLFRTSSELFSPCGLYGPEELRRSFRTSATAFILHVALLIADGDLQSFRLIGLLIWPLVFPFAYAFRGFARERLIAAGGFGVPIAIIGNGLAARRAIRELHSHPQLGYVPVAVFTSERTEANETKAMLRVPLVGRSEMAATFTFPYRVNHAMLAIGSGWSDERNHALAQKVARRFNHLQIFSNAVGDGHWLARARPLGAHITIETRHARFAWNQRLMKRAMDIAISLPALVVAAPVILIAGAAILIADPGPIFFSQTREGRRGKPIRIYKLRSMVKGAEAKLSRYLSENPAARFEYERTMKLRDDPRIIPVVGKALRKASIDELPQLWSILKGDMSLVGPRVMPTSEINLYSADARELRRDMLPGLTGFWQVEHRNESDFKVREVADSFYVANWSVWLDLWIILRTVRVVATGEGAF